MSTTCVEGLHERTGDYEGAEIVVLDPDTARHIGSYVARRDNSDDELIFFVYSASHSGVPHPSMEVVELRWVTSGDVAVVTDAERQLITTLVERDLID